MAGLSPNYREAADHSSQGTKMLTARRVDPPTTSALELVEERPPQVQVVAESPPAPRTVYGRVPAFLLLLAAAALVCQAVWPSTRTTSGIPLLVAGGALALAAVHLIVPFLVGQLRLLLRVEPIMALVLAGAAFLAVHGGVPEELIPILLLGAVVGAGLWVPMNMQAPVVAAVAVIGGYLAGSGLNVSIFSIAAPTAGGALMCLNASRTRRMRNRLEAHIDSLVSENARLAAQSAARDEESIIAKSVLQVAEGFTTVSDNPTEIADQIARRASVQVGAVGALLLLWDETVETFRIGAIHGQHVPSTADLRQVEVRPEAIPTLRQVALGEVVHVNPSALNEPVLRSILRRWNTTELLGIRLQRGEQLLGLLFTARAKGQGRFSARESNILTGIAGHAASALDHAGLIADLQSANQLKEEFMATMSHELRTPLNVIIGYTDLQMEGAFGDLPQDHLDTLATVREQALQLLELIQATLDMSRLERGLVTVDLRDISVSQFMDQLRGQVPRSWRKPTVELHWRIEPALQPIRTDPAKLQILLRNLIHNALKFTHHGMVNVSVAAQPGVDRLTFVVQDSGVGIKSENLSDIFEMFRQAPNGEAAPGGVGLGLYIVKRLAAVLGAEIEVSSAPGRGATFRIHLPFGGPLARPSTPSLN
jgi:signal transduction histidine kinase